MHICAGLARQPPAAESTGQLSVLEKVRGRDTSHRVRKRQAWANKVFPPSSVGFGSGPLQILSISKVSSGKFGCLILVSFFCCFGFFIKYSQAKDFQAYSAFLVAVWRRWTAFFCEMHSCYNWFPSTFISSAIYCLIYPSLSAFHLFFLNIGANYTEAKKIQGSFQSWSFILSFCNEDSEPALMISKCMSTVYKQIDFPAILWWSLRNHTMPVTIFQIFNKSGSMIFWQFSTKIIQAAGVLP